jgi:hypothetical protein
MLREEEEIFVYRSLGIYRIQHMQGGCRVVNMVLLMVNEIYISNFCST